MSRQLTDADIEKRIVDAMANQNISDLSVWNEPNSDDPTDELVYTNRLVANGLGLVDQMLEALDLEKGDDADTKGDH